MSSFLEIGFTIKNEDKWNDAAKIILIFGIIYLEVLTDWFSLGKLKFEFPPEESEVMIDLKKIVNDGYDIDMKAAESESEKKEVIQLEAQNAGNNAGKVDSDDDDFPEYEIPEEELDLKEVCIINVYRQLRQVAGPSAFCDKNMFFH